MVSRITVSVSPENSEYINKNNLSPTEVFRIGIKTHQKKGTENDFDKRFKIFKDRMVVVFIGFICLLIAGMNSLSLMISFICYICGLLFIFYGIFDLVMRVLPQIRAKTTNKRKK